MTFVIAALAGVFGLGFFVGAVTHDLSEKKDREKLYQLMMIGVSGMMAVSIVACGAYILAVVAGV